MQQQWYDFLVSQGGILENNSLIHFGDLNAELAALPTQNSLVPLTQMGILIIKGEDAKSFLQGQITCNLDAVKVDKSLLGAHCNIKGRMQSIFRISMHFDENNPEYYLHMPLVMIPYALQNFKKFAIFSKVIIEPATTLFGIGLYGSSAADLLVSGQHAPQGMVLKDYEYASNVTKYGPYTICRLPGELPRYELYASIEVLKQLWLDLSVHFKPILTSAWDLLDIHAGLPMIYPKTIDEFLPHHANLSILNGISYDKGCYLGQEVIARMQYRGKIKKHLYRALLEETHCPSPGDSVFTSAESVNESPGMVVRASISGQGTCELLVIMDEQYKNFENVRLYSADGPKLHRLDLPYSE